MGHRCSLSVVVGLRLAVSVLVLMLAPIVACLKTPNLSGLDSYTFNRPICEIVGLVSDSGSVAILDLRAFPNGHAVSLAVSAPEDYQRFRCALMVDVIHYEVLESNLVNIEPARIKLHWRDTVITPSRSTVRVSDDPLHEVWARAYFGDTLLVREINELRCNPARTYVIELLLHDAVRVDGSPVVIPPIKVTFERCINDS